MEDMELVIDHCKNILKKEISLNGELAVDSFERHLAPNCLAIIDYGALNFSGTSRDFYDRQMLRIIEDNPSITFVFRLTMGKELYADELFNFPNVQTIDSMADLDEWVKLLGSISQ
jgi:hypothetical protein